MRLVFAIGVSSGQVVLLMVVLHGHHLGDVRWQVRSAEFADGL